MENKIEWAKKKKNKYQNCSSEILEHIVYRWRQKDKNVENQIRMIEENLRK